MVKDGSRRGNLAEGPGGLCAFRLGTLLLHCAALAKGQRHSVAAGFIMKKATQTKSSRRAKPKTATHEVPVVPATEPPSAAQPSTLTVEADPVVVAVHSAPPTEVAPIVSEVVTQPSSEPASTSHESAPEVSTKQDGPSSGPPPSGPSTPRTIICRNPANGEVLGEVAAMDAAEVSARLDRARLAQREWK